MKFLSLLVFLPAFVFAAETANTTEYIIWSKSTQLKVASTMSLKGVFVKRSLRNFNGIVTSNLTDVQIKELQKYGYVVEKNNKRHVLGKRVVTSLEDSKKPKSWGITAIHAPQAQKLANGAGQGATVCVVDTGVAGDHPALAGRVIGGLGIVKSSVQGKDEWYDDHGHGTHVSGTVAGVGGKEILGVAPKASIYAVKVLDANGSGTDADVAEGIKDCIGHAQVINMSLGGPDDSQILHDAVKSAKAAGLQIACAAGNESGPVGYPAAYSECTAVSAVDEKGKFAYFSCYGPEVAFAGPGVSITSSVPGGGYETWDGTSMATPHVAGVMAVSVSRKKSLKAVPLKGLSKDQQGAGQIDAYKTAK